VKRNAPPADNRESSFPVKGIDKKPFVSKSLKVAPITGRPKKQSIGQKFPVCPFCGAITVDIQTWQIHVKYCEARLQGNKHATH